MVPQVTRLNHLNTEHNTVWYSDEYSIEVFGIQMVAVLCYSKGSYSDSHCTMVSTKISTLIPVLRCAGFGMKW